MIQTDSNGTVIKTDYLSSVYDVKKFQQTADKCLRAAEIMMKEYPFDAIAFTGTSGAAMAYILSNMMSVPLICVRKPSESSHYTQRGFGQVEGHFSASRFMIVDDFICSGQTIRTINDTVCAKSPESKLIGIVLYASEYGAPRDKFSLRSLGREAAWSEIPLFRSLTLGQEGT